MKSAWSGVLLAILGGASAAGIVVSCNFFVRLDDGCQRDEDCKAGELCNIRRRFCALPVVERCNGIDDDGDGRSDSDEGWGMCQPTVGMNQCGGKRMCVFASKIAGNLSVKRTLPSKKMSVSTALTTTATGSLMRALTAR